MNADEALALLDTLRQEPKLKDIQEQVFRHAWQGWTYPEIAQHLGYDNSHIRDVGYELWRQLSRALGEQVTKKNVQAVIMRQVHLRQSIAQPHLSAANASINEPIAIAPEITLTPRESLDSSSISHRQYWGEIIDVSSFYGRRTEIEQLQQWIVGGGTHPERNRCRLITVLGMGGIGKTTLVAKLAQQLQHEFDFPIWQSLRNAPPITEVLATSIQHFSQQQVTVLNQPVKALISELIGYLRSRRCLLIFDNFDTILDSPGSANPSLGSETRQYREGYEEYKELLRRVGSEYHSSCLILTSRVKPKILAPLEGDKLPVRSLLLGGLGKTESQEIFKVDGCFSQTETDWEDLIEIYAGNPLALKIVSTTVRDLFEGSISEFLVQGAIAFGDINLLLDEQFHRLSHLEKQVMYWLAINREWVTLAELREDFFPSPPQHILLEALLSLVQRSLIEKSAGSFTLQPVVMEYVTEQLLDRICTEFETQELDLFVSHALIKAQAKDYIRESQIRVILAPLAQRLIGKWRSKKEIEHQLKGILFKLRAEFPTALGYTGGNIINLLCQLQIDLSGYDFSHLSIWQAYLRGVNLHKVNFAYANLAKSIFFETIGSVHTVTFSPDGQILAIGDANGEIRLLQVADNRHYLICRGHIDWAHTLAFSRDSQLLASGGTDQTVRLWDVRTGQCLKNLQGHTNWVWGVAFSPDSQILASGSEDKTVKLWDVCTGQCLKTLSKPTNIVRSIAFSPDGQTIASGTAFQAIRIWDIINSRLLKNFLGHTNWVWSVAFSPDGQIIASGCDDPMVRLWDVSTGQCLKTLSGHINSLRSVTFSPDGQLLASGSTDQTVRLWDVGTGQCLKILQGHTDWIWSVAFSPDGQILVSGSEDKTVKLWNVRTGQCLQTLSGYSNRVSSVAFAPQCNVFPLGMLSSNAQNSISIDKVSECPQLSQGKKLGANQDNRLLASGSDDRMVRIWDISSGYHIDLPGHTDVVRSVAFSPDNRILASGSGNTERTIRLWDVRTGKCLNTLRGHSNGIWAVAFNPQGNILASGSDDLTVRLWDVKTGECLNTLRGHTVWVWSVAFNPQGDILASASTDRTVKLWDIITGQCLNTLQGHTTGIQSVAFSPDGQTIASGSFDQTVRLWNINNGQCINVLHEHDNAVWSVAFNPMNSQMLASGSFDRTVRIWDVRTGQCHKTLQGHTSGIWSVAFSPDGCFLASTGEDETIKLWDIKTGECLKNLRAAKPYEGMNITGTAGISEAQKMTLKALGAIELS
jgi:WD40 repeat protein